jgi:hypothetical protein
MVLVLVNVLAALFIVVGFHVAFRQKRLRAWTARLGQRRWNEAGEDEEGVASALRMVGVMIMAFSFTSAAFANLIAYYSAASTA